MVILIEHQTIPSRFRIKKLLTYYVNLSEVLHTDIITPIVIFLRDGRDIPVRLDMGPLDRRHAFFDYIVHPEQPASPLDSQCLSPGTPLQRLQDLRS